MTFRFHSTTRLPAVESSNQYLLLRTPNLNTFSSPEQKSPIGGSEPRTYQMAATAIVPGSRAGTCWVEAFNGNLDRLGRYYFLA